MEYRTVAATPHEKAETLLQIVPVRVHGTGARYKETFALLDLGAQASLCTAELAEQLGLCGERQPLRLGNIEGRGEERMSMNVTLELSPMADGSERRKIIVNDAWTVPKLNVPMQRVDWTQCYKWLHLSDLEIPNVNGQHVEVLLGANVVEAVVQLEARVGRANQPIAVRTAFGWALSGNISQLVPTASRHVMHVSKMASMDQDLSSLVQEWWKTEEFGTKYDSLSARSEEDRRAERLLEEKTKWTGSQYETGLLWKEQDVKLPDNRLLAVRRLEATEKGLRRNSEKAAAYEKVFNDYISHDYAEKLSVGEAQQPKPKRWFLPHHSVTNPNKPNKFRVVFDAAATCQGVSLNDKLMTGPDLLQSLPGVLIRFRLGAVAMVGDIEHMFHRVQIIEDDRPALSFLWRGMETTRPPDVYQMKVAIFGARSSPACASFVLKKTADDHRDGTEDGEAAAAAVKDSFYMDDFLRSARDAKSAVVMRAKVTELVAKGAFRLCKWLSNSREVLASIPESEWAFPAEQLHHQLPVTAVLGIKWNVELDTIGLEIRNLSVPETKRGVLKSTASIFDPFGMAAPFVLRAKILLQQLWSLEQPWDFQFGGTQLLEWQRWINELPLLGALQIPRCIQQLEHEDEPRELHVFCDASQSAFAAVVYLRLETSDGEVSCSFIMGKSRVAPVKTLTIVRLELQAAVMAVRLAEAIRREIKLKLDDTVYWSDSKTVLQYICNESRRFHVFVSNRIAEIRESSRPEQWRHVPSLLNPADDGSRGTSVAELTGDCHWLSGPMFLRQDKTMWPPVLPTQPLSEDPEVKLVAHNAAENPTTSVLPDPVRYSSWLKLRRVVAWVHRFLGNLRASTSNSTRISGPLAAGEIQQAEIAIIRSAQLQDYADEVAALTDGKPLQKNSRILPLTPYLDDEGVMRARGRLQSAPLAESIRHPVLLSCTSEITRLIVVGCHHQLMHSGVDHVLNEVRQHYWFPRARGTVRRIVHDCAFCKKRRATPQPPLMADLPRARFDTTFPFHSVGIDFFGPMLVRKFRKTEKRYCLLITCLTTRALHLELVNSLDTDGFLLALRRFIARRGSPAVIYSDNGTNFKGGERELRMAIAEWNHAKIADSMTQKAIIRHFNPPAAPHMGGVWERLVSSVKRALRVVLDEQIVSDEVLHTVLVEVEAMLNSRPLTYVASDDGDPEALTPNHILLGRPCPSLPPGIYSDRDLSTRRAWRRAQAIASSFWRRWMREYLPTLLARGKWTTQVRDLRPGDVTLIVDGDSPRGSWPLARVSRVFPGADGRVRSVELKTSRGTYRRPATKICLLEGAHP